jgi:cytochrome c2
MKSALAIMSVAFFCVKVAIGAPRAYVYESVIVDNHDAWNSHEGTSIRYVSEIFSVPINVYNTRQVGDWEGQGIKAAQDAAGFLGPATRARLIVTSSLAAALLQREEDKENGVQFEARDFVFLPREGVPAVSQFMQTCIRCHSVGSDAQGPARVGPLLAGVVGRQAGSLGNFEYSNALETSHIIWGTSSLYQFLSGPTSLVPGTRMPASIGDPNDRIDMIAFLMTLHAPNAASKP